MKAPGNADNPFIGLVCWLFTVAGIVFAMQHGPDATSRRLLTAVMWGDLPICLIVGWVAGKRLQQMRHK